MCPRTCDKRFQTESNTVLGTVLRQAADAENSDSNTLRAATTAFSVQDIDELHEHTDDTPEITHGYSTDNHRDLRRFNRLYEYTEYEAEEAGVFVDTTTPKNTSKRCAECGCIQDGNRPTRDTFECQKCDTRNHADYNAAKNVTDVYLRREQQSSRGRGVSQYALNSGTVTPNRGYTPYPDGVEAESTDKPHPQRSERASAPSE